MTILDGDEKIAGVLSRYHLLRPRRKRVVLVDHNEAAQSVPGLEEAELLEIIDHHRLADIQTTNPIYVRNEPVGSTNTILAGMYSSRPRAAFCPKRPCSPGSGALTPKRWRTMWRSISAFCGKS